MSGNLEWQLLDWAQTDWSALDASPDRTVFQTRAWLEFIAATQGGKAVVAALHDGERRIALFSGVLFRRLGVPILGSPFPGWSTDYMGFNANSEEDRARALAALPRLAFELLGAMHLECMDRHISFAAAQALGYAAGSHHTFLNDLTQSEETLLARMSAKSCRYSIRKAEKSGVRIEECAGDDAFARDYFTQLEDVFAKQRLVPTYPLARVTGLIRALAPTGNLLLLRARDPDGRVIATGIYPGFNKLALLWGNASLRDAQRLCPNEALHWYAMRFWKARGIEVFDWGGGGEYKAKYGGERASVPWLRKSRYAALEQLRGQARHIFALRQRVAGRLRRSRPALEPAAAVRE